MHFQHTIRDNIVEHLNVVDTVKTLEFDIIKVASVMIRALLNSKKIISGGNGGSMADAQHFTAELVNCFFSHDRKAMNAITLGTNPAIVTAWSNDKRYESQFARELEGIGNKGDILLLITTSGNSENLINAAKKGKEMGMIIVGLLGKDGGKLKKFTDFSIIVKNESTPRIQEAHLLIYHTLAELIEDSLK